MNLVFSEKGLLYAVQLTLLKCFFFFSKFTRKSLSHTPADFSNNRSNLSRVFYKNALKSVVKFNWKQLCGNKVFSCEFGEIFPEQRFCRIPMSGYFWGSILQFFNLSIWMGYKPSFFEMSNWLLKRLFCSLVWFAFNLNQ